MELVPTMEGEMEEEVNPEDEPRLIVMPNVQKPKNDETRAEKKMRKQIRDKIVHKDHTNDPNDKKTFLKEI